MKKRIILLLIATLMVFAFFSISIAKEFEDVPNTHWAYEYISKLSDRGVISGYLDGTYRPNNTITRAEFLKLIVSESYSSVPGMDGIFSVPIKEGGKWYDIYVSLASGANPYDYSGDRAEMPISRVEAAVILDGFCKKFGIAPSGDEEILLEDLDEFSTVEIDAISNIVHLGLMIGYKDNTFKPLNAMTRAEVATIIYRYSGLKEAIYEKVD